MPSKRTIQILGLAVCACTPSVAAMSEEDSSWLLGVYSLYGPTTPGGEDYAANSNLERYIFEDEGNGLRHNISGVRVVDEFQMSWELVREDEAHARLLPFDERRDDTYVIRPGVDCNMLELTYLNPNGDTQGPAPLYRGEVCARAPDPDTHNYFERYWCHEPPPACEGQ